MKFDHKKFFEGFKDNFDDSLDQAQVDGIEFLLTQFEQEPLWNKVWKIAYGFATTFHETAGSMQPVEEAYYLEKQYSRAFMLKTQKGFRYYPYFGRGFPQTTWLTNYKRADKEIRKQRPELVTAFEAETGQTFNLVKHPEQMKHPLIAFVTMTIGMHEGWFTSKNLDDFKPTDYRGMRKIINGTDKASLIANYAVQFETILKASAADSPATNSHTKQTSPQSPTSLLDPQKEPPPILPVVPIEQPPVIEVAAVVAAPTEPPPPKDDVVSRISNRLLAIPAAMVAALTAVGTWATSAPTNIVISLVAATTAIIIIYFAIHSLRNAGKEKREVALKLEQERRDNELKVMREQQAFELQKLTLESAMRRDLNAVTIVAPPVATIPNSDSAEAEDDNDFFDR